MLANLFLFGFTKTKTGAKTSPSAPKLSYFDRRAPQLRAWVNHGAPAADMIEHMHLFLSHNCRKKKHEQKNKYAKMN